MIYRILAIWIAIAAGHSLAAEKLKGVKTLYKIEGDYGDKHSNVILSFDRKLKTSTLGVSPHGSFIQVDLGEVFIPNSGEFVDLNGPFFKKAVAFQSGKKKGAVRLFVKGKAEDMVELTKVDILNDKVMISVAHSEVQMAAAEKNLGPAAQLKDPSVPPAKDLLRGKLLTASIFCAAMLGIFLIMYLLRPFLRRRNRQVEGDLAPEQMKTLAAHALAPKQKLVLVQVGDEKLLLGLSNESISYIKTIAPKTKATPVARAAHRPTAPSRVESGLEGVVNVARRAPRIDVTPKKKTHVSPRVRANADSDQGLTPAEKILAKEQKGAKLELSRTRSVVRKEDADKTNAVQDIKQLIRDRLKKMPNIS